MYDQKRGYFMNNKKLHVTVGISAFNEAENIQRLLESILQQNQETFHLKEIIVASDGSTDRTEKIIKNMRNTKIVLIAGREREGKQKRLEQILRKAKGDIIILLDADIVFASEQTLRYLVAPFYTKTNIGLVGGNRKPVVAKTFVEKAIHTSIRAYDNIANALRNGNNPYNCHGCILALSKKFAEEVTFPKEIYSDDTFLYFFCLSRNYRFQYAPRAKVWVFSADNLHDAVSQYTRFLGMDEVSKVAFAELIEKEYAVPLLIKYKYLAQELMDNPVHSLVMYGIKTLSLLFANRKNKNATPIWHIASSTKKWRSL